MSAVNQISPDSLEGALADFKLPVVVRCWPVAHGIENSNYFVHTQDGAHRRDFVLTILEQTPYSGDAYQPLMACLDKHGLPVAAPIANSRGEYFGHFSNGSDEPQKPFLLQPRLVGQHVFNPTESQLGALGRFLARMHSSTPTLTTVLPEYPRDTPWLDQKFCEITGHTDFGTQLLMQSALQAVKDLLARQDTSRLPRGCIHADLFRDNVLFNEHGLTGVLDFHHAATGYFIYDLAVAANDWCNDSSGQFNSTRLLALLRAYHSIRPLQSAEIWLFPLFCLYAALAFWLSRKWATLPANAHLRSKNPNEFAQIVRQHLHRPCYLDERLLSI